MRTITPSVAAASLVFGLVCGNARAADLCVDGLCVVRAQVKAAHHMTRYQPLLLTVENRTGQWKTVTAMFSPAAESVRVIDGDEWDPRKPIPLRLAPNEYRAHDGATGQRLMLIGLKQQLILGQSIFVEMIMSSGNRITIPVKVI